MMIIKYKLKVMEDASPLEGERESECSICQTSASTNQINFCCNQVYHVQCIIEWVETSPVCPICRKELSVSVINSLRAIEYNIHKLNNMHKYIVDEPDDNQEDGDISELDIMDAFFDEPIQMLRTMIRRNFSFH
jgi:hypothetical protein